MLFRAFIQVFGALTEYLCVDIVLISNDLTTCCEGWHSRLDVTFSPSDNSIKEREFMVTPLPWSVMPRLYRTLG